MILGLNEILILSWSEVADLCAEYILNIMFLWQKKSTCCGLGVSNSAFARYRYTLRNSIFAFQETGFVADNQFGMLLPFKG